MTMTAAEPLLGSGLGLNSSRGVLRDLSANVDTICKVRGRVQMGNIKFESLCHSVAASVRDATNKLANMGGGGSEGGGELRQRSLEARKNLLECASGIVDHAGHPFKAFSYMDRLSEACALALETAEAIAKKEVSSAAAPTLEALDGLEKSSGYKHLFVNVKAFGNKLHAFLAATASMVHDIRFGISSSFPVYVHGVYNHILTCSGAPNPARES